MRKILIILLLLPLIIFSQENGYVSLEAALKDPVSVRKLYLIDKGLTNIPDEIKDFPNLEELILDLNPHLALNEVFETLSHLKSLKSLSLGKCQLVTIPVSIDKMQNLEELDLSDNLIENFPEGIKKLKSLKELSFFANKLKKISLNEDDLINLESIDLCYNKFKTFPVELSNLKNLRHIRMWYNSISKIPSTIKKFKNLEELNLERNNLKYLAKEFSEMESLRVLFLRGNKLKNKSLNVIFELSKLEKLDLGNNNITELSFKIQNLINLKDFNISQNPINKLPQELSRLENLEQLGIGGLHKLDWADTFTILSEVKKLSRIGMYDMKKQQMPNGFEKLKHVKTFWLTFNRFDKHEQQRIKSLLPDAEIVFK